MTIVNPCMRARFGYHCTRLRGHAGACALVPNKEYAFRRTFIIMVFVFATLLMVLTLFVVGLVLNECLNDSAEARAYVERQAQTFADTNRETERLVHDARLTLDNVNKAAIGERLYFDETAPSVQATILNANKQIDTLAMNTYALEKQMNATLKTAQTTIEGVQPVESGLTKSIDATWKSLDFTLGSVQDVSKQLSSAAVSANVTVQQTTQDLQDLDVMEKLAQQSERDATKDYETARRGWLYRFVRKVF